MYGGMTDQERQDLKTRLDQRKETIQKYLTGPDAEEFGKSERERVLRNLEFLYQVLGVA